MDIWILSSGRSTSMETWKNLPPAIQSSVKIVVPYDEKINYRLFPNVHTTPAGLKGVGMTRQWIIDNSEARVLMLDDDLRFATRRLDDPTKFTPATDTDVELAILAVDQMLAIYHHGAIAHREGANRNTENYNFDTRCLRALAYRADTLRELGVRFDRLKVMEDFDVALQLLEKGYHSCVVNMYVQDQGGSNLEGGCSQYRTKEVQAEAAHGLHALHPKTVTVVQKETKGAWGGGIRTDVRVQWKKALLTY